MTTELILLTGAGGYVGRRLAHRYLETSDVRLLLPVRSAARQAEIEADLGVPAGRVEFVPSDLESEDAYAALDSSQLRRVTAIVHAGAVTRFNAERELAFRVNVEGTAQTLELARHCPSLESFGHVSSVYATGLRDGPIVEASTDDAQGFANAYEESKWAAEQLVGRCDDLPWRILRVATVLADDERGTVTQYNAVHDTLRLCFYGLMSVLPGRPQTPLYFVTGDFVTDAIVQLMRPATPLGVYHLAHNRQESVTLEALINLAFAEFAKDESFRRKRILQPLLTDEESFSLLVEGMTPVAGSLLSSALRDVSPFARQLYVNKDLDNTRLREALDSYQCSDTSELVTNTCSQLVSTRWGRQDATP